MSALSSRKLQQARERLQNGDVAGAQFLCGEILQRAPRNPDALCLLGITWLFAGHARDALPPLQQALAAAPHHGAALENLGLAHLMLGDYAQAEQALNRAAALPGAPASVHMRLGIALLRQQRHADALPVLQRALARAPQDADCHLNLGQACAGLGDEAGARQHFEAALRLSPDHVDAMFNLGVMALGQDALESAQRRFEQVIARAPQYADALVNLGIVFQKQQRLEQALECFRRALAIDPALAPAANNLAHTLALQGRFAEAREQYLSTLQRTPGLLAAREGLASACIALGRLREAAVHLREVLRTEPANRNALSALADVLFPSGELDEAEPVAQRAIAADPGAITPHSVLADIHFVRGELDRAVTALEAGYGKTQAPALLGNLVLQLRRLCEWDKWQDAWPRLAAMLDAGAASVSPFSILCEPTTAAQQLACAQRWSAARYGSSPAIPPARTGRRHARLRVGYLSSDFHEHATAYLLAEVLELHDRERFEIFAYSYGPEDHSAMRARLRQGCEHFVDIAWDPDDIALQRLRGDELDILVDLKGYTMGARTSLLAARPCAIQINWLGYPGSMGAGFIDYLIADPFLVPAAMDAAYSERVLRMPHCYQPNDRRRPVAAAQPRTDYGLPEQGIVFCCFNQAFKITPDIFACWMQLLRAVPHSVLWLLEDNRWASTNLRRTARAQGVAEERIVIAPRLPLDQHLARYRAADLALDTFPYTSHTTASDALWAGCPLAALCGDTFAARVSASILMACGLPQLVTHSLQEYHDLALRLASDGLLLADVRAQLASALTTAPLFDAAAFTRDLETLFLDIASAPAR